MAARSSFDVVIVGGGPAGLSAALMLGRCRRRVLVVDDGQPRNARARGVHGFLSRDGTPPFELRQLARAELAPYEVALRDERVVEARPLEPGFEVTLASGERVRSRKLVLATGMRDEMPHIEGLAPLFGVSVHVCPYCDGWEVQDGALAAYAPGEERVDFALGLTTWSADVVLFTDGHQLSPDERARLARNAVRCREERIVRLEGESGRLTRVVLEDAAAEPRSTLFVHMGRSQRSELPAKLGVTFTHDHTVATGTCERTNVPGVWVVGDASRDVQFAIVAAAEGAKAAYAINRELREEDRH